MASIRSHLRHKSNTIGISNRHIGCYYKGAFSTIGNHFSKRINAGITYWRNITISMHMFDFGANNTVLLGSNRNVVTDVKHISSSLSNLVNVENIDRLSFTLATEAKLTIK